MDTVAPPVWPKKKKNFLFEILKNDAVLQTLKKSKLYKLCVKKNLHLSFCYTEKYAKLTEKNATKGRRHRSKINLNYELLKF